MSVRDMNGADGCDNFRYMIAGILDKACDMTAFLNPTENSYMRFGSCKAPGYVSWSSENRSQLVRVPAAVGEYRRAELRSPDPTANPYLAFALMICASTVLVRQHVLVDIPAGILLSELGLLLSRLFRIGGRDALSPKT